MRRITGYALALIVAVSTSACSTVGYYTQLADGHLRLLAAREPIDELLLDDGVSTELKQRLRQVQQMRDFAVRELHLPSNGSYTSYADIGRNFATWNVVATPAYSLEPKTWCFWVAGCLAYRGFYSEASANAFAQQLREQGHDVAVSGATAYSTLGWFDDPVLNTMLRYDDATLAGLLFHELAHQKIYAQDSSAFNEAFATFVENEGVRRWLDQSGSKDEADHFFLQKRRQQAFFALLRKARKSLATLYLQEKSEAHFLLEKQAIFRQLKVDYRALKKTWGGYGGYDNWFAQPLNNAHLATLSTYHRWVPAFSVLYQRYDDLPAFYNAMAVLAEKTLAQKQVVLDELSGLPQ